MAFSSAVVDTQVVGRWRMNVGTFANASTDTGGVVATGLRTVFYFSAEVNSHFGSEQIKQTISGGNVTLVTTEGADGVWLAFGL